MKPNYAEKTNSSGKFVLIIVSKWVSCYFLFACIYIFKLAGKFSRLSYSRSVLSGLSCLTINYFLSGSLLTNKYPFLKTAWIYNGIYLTIIKLTTVFAVSSYLNKIIRGTVIVNTFISILSKESCNNLYAIEKFFSNAGKKVLKLMPAGLA